MNLNLIREKQNEYPVLKKIVSFLTAGLVDYSDVNDGKYLLRKEAIEKMLPTLEGRPLVIGHQPIDPDNMEDVAVGYVTKGYWNPETGSFDCEVLVKDSSILKQGENAVSCAYVATEFGEGGRYSGIEYDAEILNGNFTHIALVDTPRYNDAKILVNSLTKRTDMIKHFFTNSAKKADEVQELRETDLVKIGDVEVEFSELLNCYLQNGCKKNEAEEEKAEETKENEDEEEKKEEANEDKEEDAKENEDEEKHEDAKKEDVSDAVKEFVASAIKNALKKNEDEEKKDNEDDEKAKEKSNALSLVAKVRGGKSEPEYETRADRIARSNKLYSL